MCFGPLTRLFSLAVVIAASLSLPHTPASASETVEPVVLYCGRSATLVEPLVKQFTEQTGIPVEIKAAKTPQLALALTEEGERSPADVFWSQDAGTLGMLAKAGYFTKLPDKTLKLVPEDTRNADGLWVGTSGRLRVLAFAPKRVAEDELPKSVFDLTDKQYKGRVGWAPTNASFQAFVTGMRKVHGDDKTKQWLTDMKANGTKAFPKNTAIIMGIANGEVDLGLPNHYYLVRFKTADKKYPVNQTHFAKGDIGNMNNLAGVGLLKTSDNKAAAVALIDFLLSSQAQQYFAGETFELPVVGGVITSPKGIDPEKAHAVEPEVDLDALDDLQGTQELLREAGLI